jgi:hypothetical protein
MKMRMTGLKVAFSMFLFGGIFSVYGIDQSLIRSVFLEANEDVKSLPLSSSSRIPGHQHFFNPTL